MLKIRSVINPNSSRADSFKYSVILSLQHYEIPNNPERIRKLMKYENKYDFTCHDYVRFEYNNRNFSSNICNKDKQKVYSLIDNSPAVINLLHIDNRYTSIKNLHKFFHYKDKYCRLNQILQSFSHEELKEFILNNIK